MWKALQTNKGKSGITHWKGNNQGLRPFHLTGDANACYNFLMGVPAKGCWQACRLCERFGGATCQNKIETHVITYHDYLTGEFEENGVKTYRVTNPVKTHISVLTWVLTLNQEVERAAANIYYRAAWVDL
jgi:hypothetical protein